MKQLNFPQTNITPGTTLRWCKYTKRWGELCQGGLVFEIGGKESCRECVKGCAGCIEMRVNFNPDLLDELAHLIYNPELLRPDLRERLV